jgi:membrane protein implicated in regulation of membrane protease activity
VSSGNCSGDRTVYVRLALLIVGWASAGALLYVLSTFLAVAALVIIAVVAWAIVRLDRVSRKNKSLASLLGAITALLTGVCGVALRVTHRYEGILWRLNLRWPMSGSRAHMA